MASSFYLCVHCGTSIVLPHDEPSFGPWIAAHLKSCPGELHRVARARAPHERREDLPPMADGNRVVADFLDTHGPRVVKAVLKGLGYEKKSRRRKK